MFPNPTRRTSPFRRLPFGLLLVLALTLLVTPAVPAVVADDEDREAEVAVTLWANPSVRVMPGETLGIKFRLENYGSGSTAYTRLHFPYDQTQLTLIDTLFESEDDYVYEIDEQVTLHIGSVGRERSRFGVVFFRVADHLPPGTVINMWASYDWEDSYGNYDLDELTNAAPVIVGEYNETSDYVWMAIDPVRGPVGTEFGIFSDRFMPGERVDLYVRNAVGDERRYRSESQTVDPNGRVWLRLDSSDLYPGTFQIILRGHRTELEATAEFVLE